MAYLYLYFICVGANKVFIIMGGSVVWWVGRRTSDRKIAGSTPGRCIAG